MEIYPHHIDTWQLEPRGLRRTRAWTMSLVDPDAGLRDRLARWAAHRLMHDVMAEDVEITTRVQRGVEAPSYRDGVLNDEQEVSVVRFQRQLRKLLPRIAELEEAAGPRAGDRAEPPRRVDAPAARGRAARARTARTASGRLRSTRRTRPSGSRPCSWRATRGTGSSTCGARGRAVASRAGESDEPATPELARLAGILRDQLALIQVAIDLEPEDSRCSTSLERLEAGR